MAVHNIKNYGAKESVINNTMMIDTSNLFSNTKIIQQVIDSCETGDVIYVPAGTFVTGALFLKSNMTLKVDGRLFGSSLLDEYPIIHYRWEGREQDCYASLINTREGMHQNISICGTGVIDANGKMLFHEELKEKKGYRGRAVCIRNTDGITITDVTIRQSPAWCLHLIYSKNILLDSVKIFTKYDEYGNRYEDIFNGDGFDCDSCRDVVVKNCIINSQDDCIAIKSGRDAEGRCVGKPSENVEIYDCTFANGFGVAIGSETSGGIKNIRVKNCTFHNSYSVASIKSPRGRGAVVEDIVFENCRHENLSLEHTDCKWFRGAIYVDMFYGKDEFDETAEEEINEGTPIIKDITFKNILSETIAGNAIYITGLKESPIRNVSFVNVQAKGKNGMVINNVCNLVLNQFQVSGGTQRMPVECIREKL